MLRETLITPVGQRLATVCCGASPRVVLIHAGVADARGWTGVMEALRPDLATLAYDAPGFGSSPVPTEAWTAIDQLRAVVDHVGGPVICVGNSQGGRVALDLAAESPGAVAGLVLIAPAVSGAPELDWATELGLHLFEVIEAAEQAGDAEAMNRYEALVWLDGPGGPEGRVGGANRELFLTMNGQVLANEASGLPPSEPSGVWHRLEKIDVPTRVLACERDLAGISLRCGELARRLPNAELVELPDVAHLPMLEQPEMVADHVREFSASL